MLQKTLLLPLSLSAAVKDRKQASSFNPVFAVDEACGTLTDGAATDCAVTGEVCVPF